MFEVIIPRRGVFEVQRTIRSKNFKAPEADFSRLVPVETGSFTDLPKSVKERYNALRKASNKYVHSLERARDQYMKPCFSCFFTLEGEVNAFYTKIQNSLRT